MRWATNRADATIVLLLVLAQLLLNGCARRPWTTIVEGPQQTEINQAFATFTASQKHCLAGWDSDITLKWKSTLRTFSINAYCQALEPSHIKFVVFNPLGQPIKIISINGDTYQLIDALAKTSVTGNLYSWAMDNDLPGSLIERPWLAWLQGRTSAANDQIVEIRLDGKERGAWLSVMASPTSRISEYLLFDPENLRILERIILDDRGKRLAIIEYPRWQQIDGCLFPEEIAVGELPLGAQAWLGYTDTRWVNLTPADFSLEIPSGFRKVVVP